MTDFTDVYINWKPSSRLVKKAEKIYKLHYEDGLTYNQIQKRLRRHSAAYINHLSNFYRKRYVETKQEVTI